MRISNKFCFSFDGPPNASNLRTFIDNFDRVAKKYNYKEAKAVNQSWGMILESSLNSNENTILYSKSTIELTQ